MLYDPMGLPRLAIQLAVVVLGLLTAACGKSLVPFTHEIRVQHRLTDADIKNLQFYVSHTVVLRRELEEGGRQITGNHKLLLVSGKTIEEVVIEDETPGIAVDVRPGALSISFEPDTSLVFSTSGELDDPRAEPASKGSQTEPGFAEGPDPFPGNKPRDQSPEPEPFPVNRGGSIFGGNYRLAMDSRGRVSFGGSMFGAIDDSARAHLLIDAETLEQVVEKRKVLPGMRLGK
jgi:hypothetical protein